MNAEFQRIARGDKKALLNERWEEIEENNRMGKTRDFFKKIRNIKGTFHVYSWQEYTEELYKKGLNDPDNHDSVVSHLEPDILECEVMWALGRITTNKPSGGDGILAVLLKILKDDPVKKSVVLRMSANLENSAVDTELEKVSFHPNPKERQCQIMFKLWYNCAHFTR